MIKDLAMSSSWIIQLSLKSNHNCLHKRQTEEDLRQTHRRKEGDVVSAGVLQAA